MTRRWLPAAVLLAEALVFFRQSLFSTRIGIPWDLRAFHLPLATFFVNSIRAGGFPLWDPYTYCGFPFYANPQAQTFYPPSWLAILAPRLPGFLEWEVAGHVFLAGLFTYLLLRRLGAARESALLGGTVFELGGFFASQAQHLGAVCAGAWMPLAWLCVVEMRDGVRVRWVGLLSLSFAMALLAGFPAVGAVVVGSTLFLALALARRRPAIPAAFGIALVWAAALAAVQLGPGFELTRLSNAPLRGNFSAGGGGVPWQGLVSMVAPNHYHLFDFDKYKLPWNPTFLYLYAGIPGLALAVAALFSRRANRRFVFAWVTVLSGLWMLGDHTPVERTIFHLLPVAARSPLYAEFAMAPFLLGVAVLAGLGARAWIEPRGRALSWVLVLAAAADLTAAGSGRPMNTMRSPDQDSIVTPTIFEGSAKTVTGIRELIDRYRPPARVDVVDDSTNWASGAPAMKVPTPNGNDPLALSRVLAVTEIYAPRTPWVRYSQVASPGSRILDMLNVRYLLSWETAVPASVRAAGLPLVAHLPGHNVYENADALPRFFLVARTRRASGVAHAVEIMQSEFEPAREAIVEDGPSLAADVKPPPVEVLEYSPTRVVLEADSPVAALLVSSEAWYPGWRATVDGSSRPLLRVNAAFRGISLPAGRHRVAMVFAPRILCWSGAVSVMACLLLGAAAVRYNTKSRSGLSIPRQYN